MPPVQPNVPQLTPQEPQLAASVWKLTQRVPQALGLAVPAQEQNPPWQEPAPGKQLFACTLQA